MAGGSGSTGRRRAMLTRRRVEQICAFLVVLVIVFTTLYVILGRRINRCIEVSNTRPAVMDSVTVDLTGLTRHSNGSYVTSDGLTFGPGSYEQLANGTVLGFPCRIKRCVTKCCPENQISSNITCAVTQSKLKVFFKYFETVNVLPGNSKHCSWPEKQNISRNDLYILIDDLRFRSYGDGFSLFNILNYNSIYFTDDGALVTVSKKLPSKVIYLNQSMYCIEYHEDKIKVFSWEKNDEEPPEDSSNNSKLPWHYYTVLVSIPFTVATLVVYLSLPELKTLHGKAMISHVTCLTLAYVGLALVYFGIVNSSNGLICQLFGFLIQFGLLGSFFWLNVISYDLWRTFSDIITHPRLNQNAKFIAYSCYGWGAPLAITVLSIVVDQDLIQSLPESFKPGFGKSSCWFADNDSPSIFFFLPTGVLMSLNAMMFATTLWRLWERSHSNSKAFPKDSQKNGRSLTKADHRRFYMYLKLCVAMGLTWVMEVLSFWAGGDSWIWRIGDICNTFQGVVIFIFFVCNRKTLKLISEKLNLSFGPRDDTSTSSRLTTESNFSSDSEKKSSRAAHEKTFDIEMQPQRAGIN